MTPVGFQGQITFCAVNGTLSDWRNFPKMLFSSGGITQLEVEVRSSITHTLTVSKVREWSQRGVRTPKEAVLKERLRALLT